MITMARESRGLTQTELAELTGTSQGSIAHLEKSENGVSEEWLTNIAEATHYPSSFFYQPGGFLPQKLNFRKREKVSQAFLSLINVKVNIYRLQLQQLFADLQLELSKLPSLSVTEQQTPAMLANRLRKIWDIPEGPIANLTSIIEDHGIPVCSFDFTTERVDSRCIIAENGLPIIFINSHLLGDRRRFSLAYELGHLIMHMDLLDDWTRDTNHEAKLFAAELLMPAKDIRKDFEEDIDIQRLGELKLKWKASMISLLYRADDLGFLAPIQKGNLIQEFNKLQIRRREPVELDVPIEKPKLIKQWLAKLKSQTKLSTADLAEKLHLHTDEFIERYNE